MPDKIKPEKKVASHREDGECGCKYLDEDCPCEIKVEGYNQACDDWEKWLPSIEDLVEILLDKHEIVRGMTQALQLEKTDPIVLAIAKAISKRIRGER